jgi:uncharacterized membrane protein
MKLTSLSIDDLPRLTLKTKASRWISAMSYVGLLIFFSVWYLGVIAADAHPLWSVWILHTVPLLAFAPFIVKGVPRSHVWLCFILLLYFSGAVLMTANGGKHLWGGLVYAFLVVVLFTSAMMYARWASQLIRLKRQLSEAPSL